MRAARSKTDLKKLDEILTACPGVSTVCLDVANREETLRSGRGRQLQPELPRGG